MSYYAIAEVNVNNDSWVPEYIKNVTQLVHRHGGKYLARTPKIEKLEGERKAPQLLVILEFPSRDAATAFYSSAEYKPYLRARQQGASTDLMLVAGEDMAAS
jgi:uncharacterized protein (DUF1330 family)